MLLWTIENAPTVISTESVAWVKPAIAAMREAGLTGAVLTQASAAEDTFYTRFGIPPDRVAKWLLRREQLVLLHDFSSPPSLDPCSAQFGNTTEVQIELHLLDLQSIEESSYEFSAT
jgi:hypothetical protein